MKKIKILYVLITAIFLIQPIFSFIKTQGINLIDENGKEFFIRGIGLGNWLLPEGYMWKFYDSKADRPRRIEKAITRLIGEEKAKEFWSKFREYYIAEDDIKQIKESGFNTVRLPINWRILMNNDSSLNEEGFTLINNLIKWCKKYNVYIIIDLHGAPGGQTGRNIDDSENNQPELFLNEKYEEMTVKLWQEIVQRYKNEQIILGYDLLNEPLPSEYKSLNQKLEFLYEKLILMIRKIDINHIIILEGANWAIDWSIFTKKYDSNMILSFHKYWDKTDQFSIESFLKKRDELNVPIWCGETGENNNDWYKNVINLFEKNKIHWTFWSWKKLNTSNCPCSIKEPSTWDKIVDDVSDKNRVYKKLAQAVLDEYLENIKLKNCKFNKEVINALFNLK